jgi:SAM-dependent methyltransferase
MPLIDWEELRALYSELAVGGLERSVRPGQPHYAHNVAFARQRFQEGLELAAYFHSHYGDRPLRLLDLGAGAGGVSSALANEPRNRVTAVDVVYNRDLAQLVQRSGLPIEQTMATADALPFADQSFDAVLCLETIEHLPDAARSAKEMMRILRPGGQVMITTPARLRFLFRPDPHFQVRGLMLLPDGLQRRVVVDRLRLTTDYDVQHIFWSAGGMVRLFPGWTRVDTLVAIPWPGRPRNVKEALWKLFRGLLWDRIVIWK